MYDLCRQSLRSITKLKLNILKQAIIRFKSSLFLQNVASLATGTTLAQALSIFTAPILYRIYNKEDYGTLGLYMAIVGIIGVFSSMQYTNAILIEREDEDAKVIMWLSRLINIIVSLITLVIVFFFGESIGILLGNDKVTPWLYIAPLSIFFSGQEQIFRSWANRKKKYRILTSNTILTALIVPFVSISIGLYNNGPFGLFLGLIIGQILPPIILLKLLTRKENLGLNYFKIDQIKDLAKKYKKFPIYSLPATFVNNLSHNLPTIMFSKFFGAEIVALYSLANRMLGIPTNIISNAVSQVYNQKVSELYNKKGKIKIFYLKTLKSLLIVSILGFGLITILIPFLFPFLFGSEWNGAIQITQIMVIVFMLRFINSPLSYIIYIKEKHQIDLIASIYFVASTIISFWAANYYKLDYIDTIWVYVLNFCSIYIIMMFYNHKLSTN
jgi:O-antigen/teichoic acid export membrane protein